MRLLKVERGGDFSLVQLERDKMQPYAVLSHVWGETDQELTFRDLMDKTGKQKAGYEKIDFCAKQAEEDNIQYIWVDTCCIDKSSSAELSEAINSMYHWYEDATKCYAYLSDVAYPEGTSRGQGTPVGFPTSRWFRRGWTLQELIAPHDVVFYSLGLMVVYSEEHIRAFVVLRIGCLGQRREKQQEKKTSHIHC
jgi:hypothetical protein